MHEIVSNHHSPRTLSPAPTTYAAANDNRPCDAVRAEGARAEATRCRATARQQKDRIKRLSWEWLAEKFERLATEADHVLSPGWDGTLATLREDRR